MTTSSTEAGFLILTLFLALQSFLVVIIIIIISANHPVTVPAANIIILMTIHSFCSLPYQVC